MARDPVTGPMPREEFKALVDAPHGKAAKEIRKFDPLWGIEPGKKIKWLVKVERRGGDSGEAIVEAATEKEAEQLAEDLDDCDIRWDYDFGSFEIVDVKPYVERKK